MAPRKIFTISAKLTLLILALASLLSCNKTKAKIVLPEGYKASVYALGIPRSDGLTFDNSGNLYASCEEEKGAAKIVKIDTAQEVHDFVQNLNRADGLVYDAVADCFIVSEEAPDGRILRIRPNKKVEVLISQDEVENPEGMVLDKEGNLYIAEDRSNGNILRFSNNTLTIVAKGLHHPEGIAMDATGNLFITETRTGRILKLDSTGRLSVFIEKGSLKNPDNIIFDPKDDLLFITEDRNPSRILRITLEGTVTTFASGLSYPQGMTFDSAGNLFVSDQGLNRVVKISQSKKD